MGLLKEEDYVGVKAIMGSYNRIVKLPSGNKIFFQDRAELLKYDEDLEFARNNPTVLKVVHGELPKEKKTEGVPKEPEEKDSKKLEKMTFEEKLNAGSYDWKKRELKKLEKKELIKILENLGSNKIPAKINNKIELILELQKGDK